MLNLAQIRTVLSRYYDMDNLIVEATAVSGGDIHQCSVLTLHGNAYGSRPHIPSRLFIKCNSGLGAQVLESEFESLKLIFRPLPQRRFL